MKKKLMSIGLTVFLMFGVVPTGYAGERISENPDVQVLENTDEKKEMQEVEFKDLDKSHWAYDSINAMNEKGIIVGYDDNKFKPDNTVTYAEFIKMAVIADHEENVGVCSEGHWANNYYQEALDRGYFDRADISYIQLDDQISRSDMALILSNIIGDKEVANYESLDKALTDIKTTAKNEYHIKKVYTEGILSGYPDNTFKPEKTLSRAEAASVIYRLVDKTARVFPNIEEEEEGEELILEVEEETYTVELGEEYEITAPIVRGKLGENGILNVKKAGIGVKNWKPYLKEGDDFCILFSETKLASGDFRIYLDHRFIGGSTLWINSKEGSELRYVMVDGENIATISPRNNEELKVGEYPLILLYYPDNFPDNPCKFIQVTDVTVYNHGNGNLEIIKH